MDFNFKEHEQKVRAEREAADRSEREREAELRGIATDLKEQVVAYARDINPFTSSRVDKRVAVFAYELSKVTVTVHGEDSYEVLAERVNDSTIRPKFPDQLNKEGLMTFIVKYIDNNL
ncbi:UNVERIFIED_ORG: hypothetical protein M2438_002477 [Methylobacterium sp. SuP10 SLI 274]|uniref:hypothetical protein n=1 Tax=Methylorubrum extorquens TaxID=408 RepID=UPI00209FC224|nr:hypothetical protein [Methylorubrum extorquens]MDF9863700.1 hypothetical protein [Methylorubrum pseudosasae]MDH6637302.1 hypothetical protein [Methylobacterium sp. SuP10 SLI 274]MDH6666481.1 hypothetical protein [Methylorubrum zatmanii]MCP1558393.1 hypothetical protein [Methylorubrum extorquens]MDF9792012.1 hypothetical protein [Methylorubrum extorquens]